MLKKLYTLAIGETSKIIGFKDNDARNVSMRVGIYDGKTIKCISKHGPIVIILDHQTVAIGKQLALKIYIE